MANRMAGTSHETGPLKFEEVLAAEQDAGYRPAGKPLGLAFSGGGIRSATFNLGVIQALAEKRLLQRFHYLSTISGGGYIGGWLSLFIRRWAGGDVSRAEEELKKREGNLEHTAIRFLRSYSNYLTPRIGLSADTLTAVATYLRNLLLNLCVLVALLATLLLVPRVVVLAGQHVVDWSAFDRWYEAIMFVILIVATSAVALSLFYKPTRSAVTRPWYIRRTSLVALIDVPVVAAAFFATCYHLRSAATEGPDTKARFLSVLIVYVFLWVAGVLVARAYPTEEKHAFTRFGYSREKLPWYAAFALFSVLAGAVGAMILIGIAQAVAAVPDEHRLWAAVTLGPPAVIIAFLLMLVAHIGLMGRKFTEGDRELWSVFGGRLLALALAWAVFFAIAIYGPAAIAFSNDLVATLGGVAWVASTLFGVLAGRSKTTGTPDAKPWLEVLTRIAPYVFSLGLLLVLSWGLHRALDWGYEWRTGTSSATPVAGDPTPQKPGVYLHAGQAPDTPVVTVREVEAPRLWDQFLEDASKEYEPLERWFDPHWALPLMFAIALIATLLLSWRMNINLYSLHHFYRNRLTRCYLGATNPQRRSHPLTGFDAEDDVQLFELAGQKPLHIIGTAINLNRGRQLAWQNRRAASFAFTPQYAGYEPASRQISGGFRDAAQYGKDADRNAIQLGTAIAISGAAASPNQGFHTSRAVAFLMTVFNVRLGHWCGNTAHRSAWQHRDPLLSLRYWWAELTGTADQDYPFVSLSDGGHFENLGVYELVRRRCSVILASDAGADPKYVFDDLAEARRKCYTDFGVDFRFKTAVDGIRPPAGDQPSVRHYAIAEILYPDQPPGTLIYWKASITADLPPDIMHYRRTHEDFPHQTTADQFFDESQFESYRHLGYEVARRSIEAMQTNNELPEALR